MGRIAKSNPTTTLRFVLERISTDSAEYKPYSPVLVPDGKLIVEIPIDTAEAIVEKEQTTITLGGLMLVLRNVANAIDTMHYQRLNDKTKRR